MVEQAAADDGRSLPERLSTLTAADVDAWLVVGGFDDARPEQALEAAALVAAARRGGRTPVIWAGSAALTDEVAACFEPGVVQAIPNPRPDASTEDLAPLRHRLEELLDRLVESGGTRNLAPIGFRRTIEEIAREDHLRVVGVDLGARYATWAFAETVHILLTAAYSNNSSSMSPLEVLSTTCGSFSVSGAWASRFRISCSFFPKAASSRR